MNVRCPNIIHNANVDEVMRFTATTECEFGQHGRRIRQGKIGSDVSLDIEMDEESYYSSEEKESEFKVPTGKPLPDYDMDMLLAESAASMEDSIHADIDPTDLPAIPDLEINPKPKLPIIEKEDSEFPKLPSVQQSAPKQLKRKLSELNSSPDINEIPALEPPTKRQRIKFSKLLKRIQLLFKKKRR